MRIFNTLFAGALLMSTATSFSFCNIVTASGSIATEATNALQQLPPNSIPEMLSDRGYTTPAGEILKTTGCAPDNLTPNLYYLKNIKINGKRSGTASCYFFNMSQTAQEELDANCSSSMPAHQYLP